MLAALCVQCFTHCLLFREQNGPRTITSRDSIRPMKLQYCFSYFDASVSIIICHPLNKDHIVLSVKHAQVDKALYYLHDVVLHKS